MGSTPEYGSIHARSQTNHLIYTTCQFNRYRIFLGGRRLFGWKEHRMGRGNAELDGGALLIDTG